jgi:hypothetical protein
VCLEVFWRESEKKSEARKRCRKGFRHFDRYARTLGKGGHEKRLRIQRILFFLDMETIRDLNEFLCSLHGGRVLFPLLQKTFYPLGRLLYARGMEDGELVAERQTIKEFDHGFLGDTAGKARPRPLQEIEGLMLLLRRCLLAKGKNTSSLFTVTTIEERRLKIRNPFSFDDQTACFPREGIALTWLLCLIHRKGYANPDVTDGERSDRVSETPVGELLNELGLPIVYHQIIRGHVARGDGEREKGK